MDAPRATLRPGGRFVLEQPISDDRIRHLVSDAVRLYAVFEEVYPSHVVEAVMRHLPPDFDFHRVERIVAEMVPPVQPH